MMNLPNATLGAYNDWLYEIVFRCWKLTTATTGHCYLSMEELQRETVQFMQVDMPLLLMHFEKREKTFREHLEKEQELKTEINKLRFEAKESAEKLGAKMAELNADKAVLMAELTDRLQDLHPDWSRTGEINTYIHDMLGTPKTKITSWGPKVEEDIKQARQHTEEFYAEQRARHTKWQAARAQAQDAEELRQLAERVDASKAASNG